GLIGAFHRDVHELGERRCRIDAVAQRDRNEEHPCDHRKSFIMSFPQEAGLGPGHTKLRAFAAKGPWRGPPRLGGTYCEKRACLPKPTQANSINRWSLPRYVRFGSLADMLGCGKRVRFTPKSGHYSA